MSPVFFLLLPWMLMLLLLYDETMLDIPLSVYMKHHEEIEENLKIEFVMGI